MFGGIFDIPHLLTTYGYWGVFAVVFLESGIFFLLPGDSLLFSAGIFASGLGFSLLSLVPLIFLATFLGGVAGYFIGIYLERLHKYALFRRILSQEHIDKAHQFFDEHGMLAIVLSRFVAVIRTFTPIVAGIARMEFSRFIRYSLLGSLLWSTGVTLLGYFLGRRFPWLHGHITLVLIVIVLFSVIPVTFGWYRKYMRERRKRTI